MLQRIRNHTLVQTFCQLKGNPKISICTEPLWFIPYSLFAPYQSLYMSRLGLSNLEIGTTLSIGFVLQIFFGLLGGIVTDKMGRRKATLIFDTLGWSVPCLIWAFSQNFWWFLIAAAVNASFQITNVSWNCLFIEDCPEKHITNAFMLIQLCGALSVFFAPLTVYLVRVYDLVSVMRWIYFISAISMALKFVLLYLLGSETGIGALRLEETRSLSYRSMLAGYGSVFVTMMRSSKMRLVICFMALTSVVQIATGNFFSLYVTEKIHLSDEIVAVFPVIRTVIMLLFAIGLQNLFQRLQMHTSLVTGFLLYILSHLLLLLAPERNLPMVLGYTALEASAYAVIIPRKEALMAMFVDMKERSRIYALYGVITNAITMPFGSIVGWMYDINPVIPFLFNIGVYAVCILISASSKSLRRRA